MDTKKQVALPENASDKVKLAAKMWAVSGREMYQDKNNPHYKSRYSSYRRVREILDPICGELGIFFTQAPYGTELAAGVITTVYDVDTGYSEEYQTLVPMAPKVNAEQSSGKAWTYTKRVALIHIFGFISAEDDSIEADGHDQKETEKFMAKKAKAPAKAKAKAKAPAKKQEAKLSPEKLQEMLVTGYAGLLNDGLFNSMLVKLGLSEMDGDRQVKTVNHYVKLATVRITAEDAKEALEQHHEIVEEMSTMLKK